MEKCRSAEYDHVYHHHHHPCFYIGDSEDSFTISAYQRFEIRCMFAWHFFRLYQQCTIKKTMADCWTYSCLVNHKGHQNVDLVATFPRTCNVSSSSALLTMPTWMIMALRSSQALTFLSLQEACQVFFFFFYHIHYYFNFRTSTLLTVIELAANTWKFCWCLKRK